MSSIRTRILLQYIVLLAVATAASVLVVREVSINRMNERIDAQLQQEVDELHRFVQGNDPETGRPFGNDVRRILAAFLQSDIPSRGETALTFVDGRPYLRSRPAAPYRLDRDAGLVALWGEITQPLRGRAQTPSGGLDYLAVPLRDTTGTRGVYVTAFFRHFEEAHVNDVVRSAAGVGLVALCIGSVLAWRAAGKVLDPVDEATATARAISDTDLTRRIPVRGDDEIARLASTFNEMLDRLETAFASQRAFVGDAGHELRTPITIVRGHLELLEDDPREREQTLALVMDELDRMARMVNDLLLLANSERPDFLRPEVFAVDEFAEELYVKMSGLAPRAWGVHVGGSGLFEGDRHRLTQAIMQLAENAVQHTGEGDRIELGVEATHDTVALSVRDEGPGIAPEHQEHIFARFWRERSMVGRSDGTGLGLSLVKAVAEAHRGTVHVDSAPGRGATFTIRLQRHPGDAVRASAR